MFYLPQESSNALGSDVGPGNNFIEGRCGQVLDEGKSGGEGNVRQDSFELAYEANAQEMNFNLMGKKCDTYYKMQLLTKAFRRLQEN
jgi:hypothetical protein